MSKKALETVFYRMLDVYGPQHWWPGETPFEVMVGAVLTQNTAWTNVEKAISNLRQADCLSPERIVAADDETLAEMLRPSGYFNIKATRLKNYCRWYLEHDGFDALSLLDTRALRHDLLSVNGVGPETADDILLYAFERAVFVVDAYTKRVFSRLGYLDGDLTYHQVQAFFHLHLDSDESMFNEYHALIVRHCKDYCKVKPLCDGCPLNGECKRVGV